MLQLPRDCFLFEPPGLSLGRLSRGFLRRKARRFCSRALALCLDQPVALFGSGPLTGRILGFQHLQTIHLKLIGTHLNGGDNLGQVERDGGRQYGTGNAADDASSLAADKAIRIVESDGRQHELTAQAEIGQGEIKVPGKPCASSTRVSIAR